MQRPAQGIEIVKREMRLLGILDAAEIAGSSPLPISAVHVIAYLADVLAPVWDLPAILTPSILKKVGRPFFPSLQSDLDGLVGCGVVRATRVEYNRGPGDDWELGADYALNREFADRLPCRGECVRRERLHSHSSAR